MKKLFDKFMDVTEKACLIIYLILIWGIIFFTFALLIALLCRWL